MSSEKREKARYADRESAGFGRKQGGTAERISSLAWIFRIRNVHAGVFCSSAMGGSIWRKIARFVSAHCLTQTRVGAGSTEAKTTQK